MLALRQFSKLLILLPVGTFLWDFIDGWFIKANVVFRSVTEWARVVGPDFPDLVRACVNAVVPANYVADVMNMSASLFLCFFPVFFYLLYRILFLVSGGRSAGSGAYTYKSQD